MARLAKQFPFCLTLHNTSLTDNSPQTLNCLKSMRYIPEKRQVFDCLWGDQPVIAKIFLYLPRSQRHLFREWNNLKRLQDLQIKSPLPLYYGQVDKSWVLVMTKIENAQGLHDTWLKAKPDKKQYILEKMIAYLAEYHKKGIMQQDLHLNNFLWQQDKIIMIDTGQISFTAQSLNKKQAISQLALLICQYLSLNQKSIYNLCHKYFSIREWQFTAKDKLIFNSKLKSCSNKRLSKVVKKYLRSNSRHISIKQNNHRGIFDKSFIDSDNEIADFLANLDQLMEQGEILKRGNTCFVSRIKWKAQDLVIKRYNPKGLMYSLRHSLIESRACRSWRSGHSLQLLYIPTPTPLAYIDQYNNGLYKQAYFITEYTKSHSLDKFFRDPFTNNQQKQKMAQQIIKLLAKLDQHQISHGDLKYQNILIANDGPTLIDLDSMHFHHNKLHYLKSHAKDTKRFAANWNQFPDLRHFFESENGECF